ncbi:MAG: cyclopropane-fatty-acyl-phospholipid synthase family protein [Planctomycetaceae bacterium]
MTRPMTAMTHAQTVPDIHASGSESLTDCFDGTQHPAGGWITRFCARPVLNRLRQLQHGTLVMRSGCDEAVFGDMSSTATPAIVNLHSPEFFRRLLLSGAMGAAESFMDGEWSTPDLTAVFRVFLKNESLLETFRGRRFSPLHLLRRIDHFTKRNSRSGSRRNIQEHYDLGNEFFALFLDESMMYSCALFAEPAMSLTQASWAKVDRVCQQLQLSPADHVLEIGTGWGGFALHAAKHYGCRITTTTISEEQFRYASDRISSAGLRDRVTVLKQDYRDLSGQYDKLVSLEMIEAVGRQYLPQYFATCDRLVKSTGAMLLQTITMPEQRFQQYASSVDFIQKYIFPGGFLPSITELQNCVQTETDFRMLHLHDFGHHYARTLKLWRDRFHNRLDDVREQGFSERFIRMWHYYLCYCEAAFLERATGLVQMVWARPNSTLGQLTDMEQTAL